MTQQVHQMFASCRNVITNFQFRYAHGNRGSWRAFQYLLAAMGTCVFMMMFFLLPETSHSRGVDRLREIQASEGKTAKKQWIWVWLNPLGPLKLLKYRNVLVIVGQIIIRCLVIIY